MFQLLKGQPKLVQELIQTLPYSARPLKVNGQWRPPKLRRRQVKALYEAACLHKIDFPVEHKVFFEKELDTEKKKHGFIKPQRLKSEVADFSERIDKINKALAQQTPKIEKHREEERDKRYKDWYDLGLFGKVSTDDPKNKYMVDKILKDQKNASKKKK
ncbi:hypothetical protein C9374_004877 [Naegleria lovaniensis]|uniref:MRPL25 domain-containing protein n=1 Tax=Naegleria lovaniensis TaxID=51637 RepID=A0AA88KKT9_NAELO|nr:uncharacterized protein C9374_004877 [Naegleria lovaniensis]KAG2382910.1 hypothetical protein C9374_004877 [Naegleria lovaniensis]